VATQVIKKGGKKEVFQPEKLKRAIRGAAKDARLPAKKIKTVVSKVCRPLLKFVSKKKTVKAAVLRKKVLDQLDKIEPIAAKAWRRYEQRRQARKRKRR
jgi:transcriptional regulator NrdR family protein